MINILVVTDNLVQTKREIAEAFNVLLIKQNPFARLIIEDEVEVLVRHISERACNYRGFNIDYAFFNAFPLNNEVEEAILTRILASSSVGEVDKLFMQILGVVPFLEPDSMETIIYNIGVVKDFHRRKREKENV